MRERRSQDKAFAAPHELTGDAVDIGRIADSMTNSVMQAIAKEMLKQGCCGGLGDSRALRATAREVVIRSLSRMGGGL